MSFFFFWGGGGLVGEGGGVALGCAHVTKREKKLLLLKRPGLNLKDKLLTIGYFYGVAYLTVHLVIFQLS